MATTSFRTRTTQQQPPPPRPSARQWFRLSALSPGNSATATATATATTTTTANTQSRPPTPQDQKSSGHTGLPTETGRSTPPVTSPKISLVTLSPPPATATSSPLPSSSPSAPSPSPSLATTKGDKTNTAPSPPLTPIPKPTSESRITLPLPSPKPNKYNNEPQAPYSSPSKVPSSPTTPPRQQPILPDKFNTKHNHYTAAAVSVDEEETEFISFAGRNRGAVFVDVVASPNKHKSSKNSSSDNERRHHEYSKNESPASLGGLGASANINVQGVNNSLLFNSSFFHHDPGVHITSSPTK